VEYVGHLLGMLYEDPSQLPGLQGPMEMAFTAAGHSSNLNSVVQCLRFCGLPPASLIGFAHGSSRLHDAAYRVGAEIDALQPDLIFLSTPHGLIDGTNFLFYSNSDAEGHADVGTYRVSVSLQVDRAKVRQVVDHLRKSSVTNVSTLSGFVNKEPLPLRWGEVLPLLYAEGTFRHRRPSAILMSQPSRRSTEAVAMIPELRRLGAALFRVFDPWKERVVVLASADLAHTHLPSGPYGFSPAADPFDTACGKWAATLHSETLIVTAARHALAARACGFTGLVMLDGLLHAARSRGPWRSELLAIGHPSYYGMMVAQMVPCNDQDPAC
jgi:aromatic ring-opening dioxygenase LigB subunit